MEDGEESEEFVQLLTLSQDQLFGYIMTLVADYAVAGDLRQETNMVLWRKRATFEPGSNFNAWASRIAFFQVMAWRRDKGRDKHVFCDELMERMCDEAVADAAGFTDRQAALRLCMDTLPDKQRWLIEQRYVLNAPIKAIAEVTGKSGGSIATTVYRIRGLLRSCVQQRIAGGSV
jgi:RNA polymerase sigma-70 factor (ECF subfamily)